MFIYVKSTIHTILKQRQSAAVCHDLLNYNILFFSKIISAGHLAPQYGVTMTEQQRQYSDSRSSTVTDNGCNPLKPPTTHHKQSVHPFILCTIHKLAIRPPNFDRSSRWLTIFPENRLYFIFYVGYQSKYNHILRLIPSFNVRQVCIPIIRLLL